MAMAPRERGAALGDKAPHLFLSHSSKDGEWVSQLAHHLNVCGVDVWLDAWELRVGDDLHERISDAIHKSRFVGVVLSKHFSESRWIKGEVHQALSREKSEARTVVLPLLAEAVEIPPVLSSKKWLDFADDYYASLVRLVGLVHNISTEAIERQLGFMGRDLAGCLTALEYAGYDLVHVVDTGMLREIERMGGVRVGDIVRFDPERILMQPGISPYLRDLLKTLR